VKRTYLLPVAVLLSGALAGCGQGMNANTTIQGETGNGIVIVAGDMTVASATIVAGDEGSGRGAVSAVIVSAASDTETLEAVIVDGVDAELAPAEVTIEPGESVSVSTLGDVQAEVDLDVPAGAFVDVQFLFSSSGIAAERVLVVPPIGFYEDFAPAGTSAGTGTEGESGTGDDAEEDAEEAAGEEAVAGEDADGEAGAAGE
jgi:hypothetical protein